MLAPDLLETGIYTVPEVARLVEAPQALVRTWIDGRRNRQTPVIDNQLGRFGNTTAISFTNLMELRFVALFAAAGVKLPVIRAILDEVREAIHHPHPFATKTVFKTDGKKIVAEIARNNGVDVIYDLKTRNYEFPVVVLKSLKEGVIYDPKGDALAWYPRPKTAPHVVVNPVLSFGRPVLRDSRIPTETLAQAVKAEKSAVAVAELYDVPEKQVREAVKFQENLKAAA